MCFQSMTPSIIGTYSSTLRLITWTVATSSHDGMRSVSVTGTAIGAPPSR